ncbi:hypothetical protein BC938DRAFT_472625 [Jimgerdemannia flammicorona]|uniref:Uncharacterized protein n=1 Tax=Jimgerdemannia flammicorona TaxID=994334 RepID=A0A433Q5P8_9FUNG|nr:hypothetical protein BC938DRAFT_472625 [Jimgerdemannia flammicorona]
MSNLKRVKVYRNDGIAFSLERSELKPRLMTYYSDRLITTSPNAMFTVKSVDISQVQLDTEKAPTSSSQMSNEVSPEKASITLNIITGNLDVRVPDDIQKDITDKLKKELPKETKFSLIFTGKEEFDASEKHNIIFKDLIAMGRVFIGFPMTQTTGCACHMAARFIPTVDRNAIDFTDRYIGQWNKELLAMGGLLCRIVYEDELEKIGLIVKVVEKMPSSTNGIGGDNSEQTRLVRRAIHAMLSFSFKESTPNAIVGQDQETYFLKMSRKPPSVLTSHGVVPVTEARMPDPKLSFIQTVPVVSSEIIQKCEAILKKWEGEGLRKMSIEDVFNELRKRALPIAEMRFLLEWWIDYGDSNAVTESTRSQLLELAKIAIQEGTNVSLSHIQFWLNPEIVSHDMPLETTVLPYEISKNFETKLATAFPSWRELSLIEWSQFIVTNPELEDAPTFAEKVLGVISHTFPDLSVKDQADVIALFAKKKCIPTKLGMKLPSDSYSLKVVLFDDVPTVDNSLLLSEKFLTALGVKTHVEIQRVLTNYLIHGRWSHIDLIKYLAMETLDGNEIANLMKTSLFPKEGGDEKEKKNRYVPTELYIPTKELRKLGLPILEYGTEKWHSGSAEGIYDFSAISDNFSSTTLWRLRVFPSSLTAKFLTKLGIQKSPPLSTILELSVNSHDEVPNKALSYFIKHFKSYKSSYDPASVTLPFLPCADCKTYATPSDCFLNPACAVLEFNILLKCHERNADNLGVIRDPSVQVLLDRFLNSIQKDCEKAVKVFVYMDSRKTDFEACDWDTLRGKKFIPVPDNESPDGVRLVDSSQCFFELDEPNPGEDIYMELFTYINFDSNAARDFLRNCGVKPKPEPIDFARVIVSDPKRAYDICGVDRYLVILRKIAMGYDSIKRDLSLVEKMKNSSFLIGVKYVGVQVSAVDISNNANGSIEKIVQYVLVQPKDVFVNDDSFANQVFAPVTAPIESDLEKFYKDLGSSQLSEKIVTSFKAAGHPKESQKSREVKQRISERAVIIRYQIPDDNPPQGCQLPRDEEWLRKNLQVLEVTEIKLERKFTVTQEVNSQSTSACPKADKREHHIYITGDSLKDYYDIAACLCQIMFNRSNFNEILVVQQCLIADLEFLRRRGVPIDRILKLKKASEPATALDQVISPLPEPEVSKRPKPPQSTVENRKDFRTAAGSDNVEEWLAQIPKLFPNVDHTLLAQMQQLIQRINRQKTQSAGDFPNKDTKPSSHSSADVKSSLAGTNNEATSNGGPSRVEPLSLPSQSFSPDYYKDLKDNLSRSINSCKPSTEASVSSKPEHTTATEPEARYCSVWVTRSLKLAHEGNMKFYVPHDMNAADVSTKYSEQLQQFFEVLKGLMQVFGLHETNIHVYYEKGSTIALNQNRSLFFNLHYYVELKHGAANKTEVMTYWFMTICHELSHNLVLNHDSDHEFYMSSFAEKYLEKLIDHLNRKESVLDRT